MDNHQDGLYELHLSPHRSLSRRGFLILMAAVSTISFTVGLYFWALGAWPVMGFFGLDVALIYFAFRWNYSSGRQSEIIRLHNGILEILRLSATGTTQTITLQAQWLRAEIINTRLLLTSHGKSTEIAVFLGEDEKVAVCDALRDALLVAKKAT